MASQFYAIRPLGWISEKVWVYFIGQSPQIVTINIPEKKEITDSMAYWRSCGQSLDVTEPRIPLFVVLHPSWNKSFDLKQIDQLANSEHRPLWSSRGQHRTRPGSFTSPGSNLPAVAGCASAYTRGPFINASRLSVLGRIPTHMVY